MNSYAIVVIIIILTILIAVANLVTVYLGSRMIINSKIFSGIVTVVAGVIILFNIYTPLNMMLYENILNEEYIGYKFIEIFDHKDFNELKNTETEHTKIKVYPNPTYPDDKIVEVSNKMNDKKIVLFIENDNGKAKVVDVIVDGKQVIFK